MLALEVSYEELENASVLFKICLTIQFIWKNQGNDEVELLAHAINVEHICCDVQHM